MLTVLFDGIAYGMLLFVLAVGLSVTLGLMNFVNLAHGASPWRAAISPSSW
jgi:branched-chain amino acid transport system permease protein